MMVINKTASIYSLFFVTLFLLLTQSKAQRGSNGFLAIKVGANYFKDNEGRRLLNGEKKINEEKIDRLNTYTNERSALNQTEIEFKTFPFGEISYYLERDSYFGINLGLGYQFNKTKYTIEIISIQYEPGNKKINNIPNSLTKVGIGSSSFKNHSFKMVFGLNFNTKFGLNIFFQPINPEFRLIKNDKSNVEYKNYTTYYYQLPQPNPYAPYIDSARASSVENKPFEFNNYKTQVNFSICFPTTIGFEQTITIKGFNLIAGASFSASLLEEYIIYRAYIGIPFGKKE